MFTLAIDPGGSTTKASIGYALFDEEGGLMGKGVFTKKELYAHLENLPALVALSGWQVVVENFVNNEKSRGGQTNGTSEIIGAVEFACHLNSVPLYRQSPRILSVAKIQNQYKLPINPRTKQPVKHLPDEDSAMLHGLYFLKAKKLGKI